MGPVGTRPSHHPPKPRAKMPAGARACMARGPCIKPSAPTPKKRTAPAGALALGTMLGPCLDQAATGGSPRSAPRFGARIGPKFAHRRVGAQGAGGWTKKRCVPSSPSFPGRALGAPSRSGAPTLSSGREPWAVRHLSDRERFTPRPLRTLGRSRANPDLTPELPGDGAWQGLVRCNAGPARAAPNPRGGPRARPPARTRSVSGGPRPARRRWRGATRRGRSATRRPRAGGRGRGARVDHPGGRSRHRGLRTTSRLRATRPRRMGRSFRVRAEGRMAHVAGCNGRCHAFPNSALVPSSDSE